MLALEDQKDDEGEELEDRGPRLDFLPDYELALIEEALERRLYEIYRFLTWLPYGLAALVVIALVIHWILALVLGSTVLVFVPWLWGRLNEVSILRERQRQALSAVGQIPDVNSNEVQKFNWWTLRKAGFDLVKLREAHKNQALRLAGRPWGILQYQSLRIPVFFKRRGKQELHRQNFARIAAYCQLIEREERAQAPYGIVLFGGTYEVWVVPNNAPAQKVFHEGLKLTQQLSVQVDAKEEIDHEPPQGRCKGCPRGKPHVHRPGQTETVLGRLALPVFGTIGIDRRVYHSECGDRFHWVPPHDKAREKKLCF